MAGFFQDLLKDTAKGFFGNEYLRDYTHASKTFRTNAYGYAPKFKFLFHVYFDINKSLIPATSSFPEDSNFGLAVKTVQLPKYSFELATLNQYNRKRIVQTKIKYDPIQIAFHDDNNNIIRKLWHTYYTYYYKDAAQKDMDPGINSGRDIYNPSSSTGHDWGYIGEGKNEQGTATGAGLGATKPVFFKSIDVYGFNQHNFVLYKLINPIIESFSHDTYNYSEGNGVMENNMTVQYEYVKYYEGAIDGRNPGQIVKEFGSDAHYDRTVSPIAIPGANGTILGQGGLIDGVGGVIDDLASGNILGAIKKAGTTAQTFKNPANILKIAKSEALGEISNSILNTTNRNNAFNFPSAASTVIKSTNDTLGSLFKGVNKGPPPGG